MSQFEIWLTPKARLSIGSSNPFKMEEWVRSKSGNTTGTTLFGLMERDGYAVLSWNKVAEVTSERAFCCTALIAELHGQKSITDRSTAEQARSPGEVIGTAGTM